MCARHGIRSYGAFDLLLLSARHSILTDVITSFGEVFRLWVAIIS